MCIRDRSAAEDIEAIAAVEGLDVCFVGPADLTRSLGFMGQHDVPRTAAVVEPLAAKVRSVGKAKLGIPAFHYNYERDEQALVNLGFRLITCGSDLSTLLKGFRENLKRTAEVR